MDRVRRPALRGTVLGTILRILGPLVQALLRSPIHWPLSRWLCLLRWTSRKTGRQRTLPLSYVREGHVAYLTTGDRWSTNIKGGAPVAIRLRGHWHDASADLVADEAKAASMLERLFRRHAWYRVLSGIPAARTGGGAEPAVVKRALASGRVLIVVTLDRTADV